MNKKSTPSHSAPIPPVPVAKRLILYVRQLDRLSAEGASQVSSAQLAEALEVSPAQVRKDLGFFGQFGRRGVGYQVDTLRSELRKYLGLQKAWKLILVGVGDLGTALLRHRGFHRRGVELVGAFDISEKRIGKTIAEIQIQSPAELSGVVRKHGVRLAMVATPASAVQEVTDALVDAGIRGILNFAETHPQTPPAVSVIPVDFGAQLDLLAFSVAAGLP